MGRKIGTWTLGATDGGTGVGEVGEVVGAAVGIIIVGEVVGAAVGIVGAAVGTAVGDSVPVKNSLFALHTVPKVFNRRSISAPH